MTKKVQNFEIQGIKNWKAFLMQTALVVDEVIDVSSSIPTKPDGASISTVAGIELCGVGGEDGLTAKMQFASGVFV